MADILGALVGPISSLVRVLQAAQDRVDRLGKAAADAADRASHLRDMANQAAQKTADMGKAVSAALNPVAMKSLEQAAQQAAQQAQNLGQKLQQTALTGDKLKTLQDQADKAAQRAKALADALDKARQAASDPNKLLGLQAGAGTARQQAGKLAAQASTAEGEAGAAAGGAAMAGVGAALGAVAGFAAAIQNTISQLQVFVEALNPTIIRQFSLAMRDLQATVGYAFEPIFEQATDLFRQVAGIIMPVMEQLRPIIQQIAEHAASELIPRLEMMVSIIEALLPLLEVYFAIQEALDAVMRPVILVVRLLAEMLGFLIKVVVAAFQPFLDQLKLLDGVMEGVNAIFTAYMAIFKTVTDAVLGFIRSLFGGGSGVKEQMDSLKDAIKTVIRYMLLFYGSILKFIDGLLGTNMLGSLINNLQPNKEGQKAAIQGVGTKSFESIAKDMAVASAAAAGSGGGKKTQEDYLGDAIKELQAIRDGQQTNKLIDTLEKVAAIIEQVKHVLENPASVLPEPVRRASEIAGNTANAFFHPIDTIRNQFGI